MYLLLTQFTVLWKPENPGQVKGSSLRSDIGLLHRITGN